MRFPIPALALALALATIALFLALAYPVQAAERELKVVASIKPVHSLVAAILGRAPDLILDGVSSPHHEGLKPSHAGMLQDADIVFWIGPEMEAFLEGPLDTIATGAVAVALMADDAVRKLPYRAAAIEDPGHDDHDPDPHHGEHDHHGVDGHVWLDPGNAAAMAERIAKELGALDPGNADTYSENAKNLAQVLDALDREIAEWIEPVRGQPYIVFHDAYQYFERRYGLRQPAVIAVNPEVAPGATRIRALRKRIADAGIGCIFSEPQHDPGLIAVLSEGMAVRTGVLDPLGARIESGPEHYPRLLRELASALRDCLAQP